MPLMAVAAQDLAAVCINHRAGCKQARTLPLVEPEAVDLVGGMEAHPPRPPLQAHQAQAQPDDVLAAARSWEETGDWSRAIDAYLNVSADRSVNQNALVEICKSP